MSARSEISGWYGKLPGSGDFAARGLPANVQQRLEDWISAGLIQLRHRSPDWSYLFTLTPTWAAVLPCDVIADSPVLCCIAPSTDRVGRLFPLLVLQSVTDSNNLAIDLSKGNRWHSEVAALVNQAQARTMSVEDFDDAFLEFRVRRNKMTSVPLGMTETHRNGDIFSILGGTPEHVFNQNLHAYVPSPPKASYDFSWLELPNMFEPQGSRSYWWTLGANTSKRLGHEGHLTPHLFITLFSLAMHAPADRRM